MQRSSPAQASGGGATRPTYALDRLIPQELLAKSETRTRARVLVAVSLGIGTLGAAILLRRNISFDWKGGGSHLATLVVLLILLLPAVQWFTRSNRIASVLLSLLVLITFPLIQLFAGIYPAPILMLFALVPLIATFLVGVRFGAVTGILISTSAVLLSRHVPLATDTLLSPLMPTLIACASAMPLMVFALALFYERSRTRNENQLAAINTELIIARSVAETADKRKTEFLRHMSHELRTPLNAILGYSELLLEEAEDAQEQSQIADLGKILGAGEHLLRLINDLLDISRIEADAIDFVIEKIHLAPITKQVQTLLAPLVEANGNHLLVEVDPAIEFRSDRQRLKQILINLLGNAAKFTHNGEITLRATALPSADEAETIRIIVRDTGIGIDKEDQENIFDPFSQVSEDQELRNKGTGLGLAITGKLVQLFGGTIKVDSSPGVGSTFTIDLPRNGPPTNTAEGAPASISNHSIATSH